MELISKEELRDKMYHEAFEVDSEMQKWESGCWIRYKLFEKILDEVPTVESRPKGEWIEREGYDMDTYWECSECKSDFMLIDGTPEENSYNYCPHCGAELSQI